MIPEVSSLTGDPDYGGLLETPERTHHPSCSAQPHRLHATEGPGTQLHSRGCFPGTWPAIRTTGTEPALGSASLRARTSMPLPPVTLERSPNWPHLFPPPPLGSLLWPWSQPPCPSAYRAPAQTPGPVTPTSPTLLFSIKNNNTPVISSPGIAHFYLLGSICYF